MTFTIAVRFHIAIGFCLLIGSGLLRPVDAYGAFAQAVATGISRLATKAMGGVNGGVYGNPALVPSRSIQKPVVGAVQAPMSASVRLNYMMMWPAPPRTLPVAAIRRPVYYNL